MTIQHVISTWLLPCIDGSVYDLDSSSDLKKSTGSVYEMNPDRARNKQAFSFSYIIKLTH